MNEVVCFLFGLGVFLFFVFVFENAFYHGINGSSGTHSRILFLSFRVFTAAFSLGEHSSVLKSRERKQEVLSVMFGNELHLSFRKASS